MDQLIVTQIAKRVSAKPDNQKYLTYTDAQLINLQIKGFFHKKLNLLPPQIDIVCNSAELILAPSSVERQALLKKMSGSAAGIAGIGTIIAAIGTGLGWGSATIAYVVTFFCGTPFWGPIGWGAAGAMLLVVGGYFMFSDSDEKEGTVRFEKTLREGVKASIDDIWAEHQAKLVNLPCETK